MEKIELKLNSEHGHYSWEIGTSGGDGDANKLITGRGQVNVQQLALGGEGKPWFVVFTNFCGINTLTMTDFRLPILH